MAVKTKDELKRLSEVAFPNNNEGAIQPADHRNFNEELIDSMATHGQGAKADSSVQGAVVGTDTITRNASGILQFPAYATKAQGDKADSAVQSATVDGVAVPKVNGVLQFPGYATKAQGTKADSAVQGAIIGDEEALKEGGILQFPKIEYASSKISVVLNSRERYLNHFILGNMVHIFGQFSVNTGSMSSVLLRCSDKRILNSILKLPATIFMTQSDGQWKGYIYNCFMEPDEVSLMMDIMDHNNQPRVEGPGYISIDIKTTLD